MYRNYSKPACQKKSSGTLWLSFLCWSHGASQQPVSGNLANTTCFWLNLHVACARSRLFLFIVIGSWAWALAQLGMFWFLVCRFSSGDSRSIQLSPRGVSKQRPWRTARLEKNWPLRRKLKTILFRNVLLTKLECHDRIFRPRFFNDQKAI